MHVGNLRSLTVSERGAFVNGVIELKRRGLNGKDWRCRQWPISNHQVV